MFDEVFVYYQKGMELYVRTIFFLSIAEWIEFFPLIFFLMFTHTTFKFFFGLSIVTSNHFKTKKPCVLKNRTAKKPVGNLIFGVGG